MTNEELVNAERASLDSKPAPLTEEQKARERRWRTVFHADKIDPFNKLMGEINQVNEALEGFGVGPAIFDALNDDDLLDPYLASKLTRRIEQLRNTLLERRGLLAQYEEAAAAEDLARERAAETLVQRELRELREEIAELKAGRQQEAPPRQREPARETPPMPYVTGVNTLNPAGFYGVPAPGAPPIEAAGARRGAAVQHRRGDGAQAPSGPAMPNADTLTLRPSSPAELKRALQRDFVR